MGYQIKIGLSDTNSRQTRGQGAWLFLSILFIFSVFSAGQANAQVAPAWGYDTWGNVYTYGGSCPGGQTKIFGDVSPEGVAGQVMTYARPCAPWAVYNDATCAIPTVSAPMSAIDVTCSYTGSFPGSFIVKLICSPGKAITPSAFSCENSGIVQINAPADGVIYAAPSGSFNIDVQVNNTYSTVTSVGLNNNGSNIAQTTYNATTGKWSASLNNWAAGTYMVTASATDNVGNVVTSAPVTIIVVSRPSGVAPAWGYDTWGGTYAMGGSCPGGQNPMLGDNSIESASNKIILYIRTCSTFTSSNPQCTHPSVTSPVGNLHSFCAFTGDYPGNWTMSVVCAPGKSLTPASPYACVTWPLATVAITTPTNGAGYQSPATVTIEAQVTNQNGIVTWVDVYANGGSPVAAVLQNGKWIASFPNLGAGAYTLTVVAGDDAGHTAVDSRSVNVYANPPPTVSLTAPIDKRVYTTGASIPLQASTTDDGGVTQVEFFAGATSLGLATMSSGSATSGAWVSNAWTSVPAGTYSVTAKATDSTGGVVSSAPVTVLVQTTPTLSATLASPSASGYTAPASIALTANTVSTNGIDSVQFFSGATPIGQGFLASGTATSGAYVTNAWTNVPAGTYSLTAVATDQQGYTFVSTPVTYTVGAATSGATTLYFIHADHLNTPRQVENQIQQPVWKWEQAEAFGDTPPNENPSSLGTFSLNLRFPGQYADQETATSYNYFRDYDPTAGRYVQSDPIGLDGGINTFAYVEGSPIGDTDPTGLTSLALCANPANATACAAAGIQVGGGSAVVSAALNLASQLTANGGQVQCVDPKQILKAAGIGFLTGAPLGVAIKANQLSGSLNVAQIVTGPARAQLNAAFKGQGPLPQLAWWQNQALQLLYKGYSVTNSSSGQALTTTQALNWARVQFLRGVGPAPGNANSQLYNYVQAFLNAKGKL